MQGGRYCKQDQENNGYWLLLIFSWLSFVVKGAALEEEGPAQKRSKSRKRKREDSDNQLVKELEPSEHSPTKKRKKRKKKEAPQSVSSESVQQQTSQVKKKTTTVPKVLSLDYHTLCNEPHNISHHGYSVTNSLSVSLYSLQKKGVIHKLKGGTEVEEIEMGTGCCAKPGKRVSNLATVT